MRAAPRNCARRAGRARASSSSAARSRQRRKAFRWRWMRLLDEHWIAYPQLIAGDLSGWSGSSSNGWAGRRCDIWMSFCRAARPSRSRFVARVALKPGGYRARRAGRRHRTPGRQRCRRAISGGRQCAGGTRNGGVRGSDETAGRRCAIARAAEQRGHPESAAALLQFAAASAIWRIS